MEFRTKKLKVEKEGHYYSLKVRNMHFITTSEECLKEIAGEKEIEINNKKEIDTKRFMELSKTEGEQIVIRMLPDSPKDRYISDKQGNLMFEKNGLLVAGKDFKGDMFEVNKAMVDLAIHLQKPISIMIYKNELMYKIGSQIACVECQDEILHRGIKINLENAEEVGVIKKKYLRDMAFKYQKIRLISEKNKDLKIIGMNSIFSNTLRGGDERIKKIKNCFDFEFQIDLNANAIRDIKAEEITIKETLETYTLNDNYVILKSKNYSYF